MYKAFITVILLFFSVQIFAGGISKTDLTKSRQEQKMFRSLEVIEEIVETAPEDAIKQLDDIVRYTIDQDLTASTSYAYLLMGRAYKELQQPTLALHFILLSDKSSEKESNNRSLKKVETSQEQKKQPIYYLELAEIYRQLGDYLLSNENYNIFKKQTNNDALLREADYAIGQNYYALEDYNDALIVFEDLLAREQQVNNTVKINDCYSYLAACHISLGNIEKGLTFYKLSTQLLDAIELEEKEVYQKVSSNKEIVSKALRKQNKFDEELSIRTDALNVVDDGLEYLRLAQTYYQANNLQKAIGSLDTYFENISYDLIDESEIAVIRNIAIDLRNQNQDKKALDYLLKYQQLSDTIDNRLNALASRTQELGTLGRRNILQLEILQKDKQLSKNTIDHLMRETDLKEDIVGFQKTIIYLLSVVVFIGILVLLYIVRVSKQRRVVNQQLALRSLRSQMNPHFIFNALNSVNSFISMSDERSANKFLSEFSTLMRTVMENSEHDFISLTKELEIIKIYIELEHFRFKDKFSYELDIDENIDEEAFILPPMIVQPYIENAIWHGLRYKEEVGKLKVSFQEIGEQLKITIQDDGIGREKSKELKTKNQKKNKSTALKNIGERIQLFNKLHKITIDVTIESLYENGTGTIVTLLIPQPKK